MGNTLAPGYLPGQILKLTEGDVCDTKGHQGRVAVLRLVGECDSFGSESTCYCIECAAALDSALPPDTSGVCEWCKCTADHLARRRDRDEGMGSPVYEVCMACVRKDNKDAQAEIDSDDDEQEDTREAVMDAYLDAIEDSEPFDTAQECGIIVRPATLDDDA